MKKFALGVFALGALLAGCGSESGEFDADAAAEWWAENAEEPHGSDVLQRLVDDTRQGCSDRRAMHWSVYYATDGVGSQDPIIELYRAACPDSLDRALADVEEKGEPPREWSPIGRS